MADQLDIDRLKARFAQQARARLPFNPVDGVEITGANVERLKVGMETFGWSDFRFVTKEQAQDNSWSIKKGAESVRVVLRNAEDGAVAEKTLFNAQDVRGMPSLDEMLAMSDDAILKMRGKMQPVVAPEAASQMQVDMNAVANDIEDESDIEIGPARTPEKLVSLEAATDAPQGRLKEEQEVRDLFLDAAVDVHTIQSQEVPAELREQLSAPTHENLDERGFAVMAPYWLDGLHNHEGVELAKQINRLVEARRLAEDKAAIATLLNSYPDRRRLGLDIVPRSKYLSDPHLKANVSEPVQLLGGELVRDKEGAYRPKAGGTAVVIDKGTSLVLKSKTEQAYRGAMELALAKGWKAIELKGKPKMLAQAWVEAQMKGLEVVNYTPTEKDREQLAQRMAEEAKNRELAAVRTEQLQPETVEVRPVIDAAGKEVTASMTYTVVRTGMPPKEFGTPMEAAKAFLASPSTEETTVTRTVTRVDGVVRTDVVASAATKTKEGDGNAKENISLDVLDHEFEAALAEAKREQGAVLLAGRAGLELNLDLEKGGRLVAHGPAPYDHNPKNKESYFVTVENDEGQSRTVWGADLPRSLSAAGAMPGDTISLREGGREPVEVEVTEPDGSKGLKTTNRVNWTTTVLSRVVDMANPQTPKLEAVEVASKGTHIGPILRVEDGRIAQKAGRDPNKLIWHDVSKLQGRIPGLGEMAEIKYLKGVAKVKEPEREQELSR